MNIVDFILIALLLLWAAHKLVFLWKLAKGIWSDEEL